MNLKKIGIKNYKIFKYYEIDFTNSDINILIGRNNSGKSTILEIVDLLFTKTALNFEDFNKDTEDEEIQLIYEFQGEQMTVVEKKYSVVTTPGKEKVKAPKIFINNQELNKSYYAESNIDNGDLEKLLLSIGIPKVYYMNPNSSPDIFQKIAVDIIQDRLKEEDIDLEVLNNQLKYLLQSNIERINQELATVNESVNGGIQKVFATDNQLNMGVNLEEFILEDLINKVTIDINFEDMNMINQGTGFQRILILTLIKYSMEEGFLSNKLLLIDEPEAYLHPQAIKEVSKILYEINGIQTVISTHSPVMIDITKENRSIKLMKVEEVNTEQYNILYEETDELREEITGDVKKQFQLHNIINPYLNEFFFAKNIIIVEGDVEYLLFKKLLEEDQFNNYVDTKVINAHGKDTIVNYMTIINNFNIAYAILTDLDNFKTSKNGNVRNSSVIDAMKTKTQNIFNKRIDNCKIIVANGTFEYALNGERISNSEKVENVNNILNDRNLKSQSIDLLKNLLNIECEEIDNFEVLTDDIINNKYIEEGLI